MLSMWARGVCSFPKSTCPLIKRCLTLSPVNQCLLLQAACLFRLLCCCYKNEQRTAKGAFLAAFLDMLQLATASPCLGSSDSHYMLNYMFFFLYYVNISRRSTLCVVLFCLWNNGVSHNQTSTDEIRFPLLSPKPPMLVA